MKKRPKYSILNGDAFELIKNQPDSSIDAIVTDPPYGMLRHRIEVFDTSRLNELFLEFNRVLKDTGYLCYFGNYPQIVKWNAVANQHFMFNRELIWFKVHNSAPFLDFPRATEIIRVYSKKRSLRIIMRSNTAEHGICSKEILDMYKNLIFKKDKQTADNRADAKEIKIALNFNKPPRRFTNSSIVRCQPHNRQSIKDEHYVDHPTVKPLFVLSEVIKAVSAPGDTILDPFLGSGSTAVAGIQTHRHAIGYELYKDYYDTSLRRCEAEYGREYDEISNLLALQ